MSDLSSSDPEFWFRRLLRAETTDLRAMLWWNITFLWTGVVQHLLAYYLDTTGLGTPAGHACLCLLGLLVAKTGGANRDHVCVSARGPRHVVVIRLYS